MRSSEEPNSLVNRKVQSFISLLPLTPIRNIQWWKRNRKAAIKNPDLKKSLVHCSCEINDTGSEFQKPPEPAVKELPWLDLVCSLEGSFLFVVLFWPHVLSLGKFSLFPHLPCHLPKQMLGSWATMGYCTAFLASSLLRQC